MKHPYDEVYLNDVIEEQGRFFEGLQDEPSPIDSADLLTAYMHSSTRRQLDEGQAWYLTLDAERIKSVFLQESGYVPKAGEPLRGFLPKWMSSMPRHSGIGTCRAPNCATSCLSHPFVSSIPEHMTLIL